jgi:hypothetical protein
MEQSSTPAQLADISLIRAVVCELTRKPTPEYSPGSGRRAFACPHYGKVFSSRSVRAHIPRCESKPSLRRKTWAERALGAKPLSLADVSALIERDNWLNGGVQGAD